jgi:L-ascorbate metabolism protein UlaG (beta-lactamase superfamily)
MTTELTWLGHFCWLVETGGTKILIDPFLDDSPTAPIKSDRVEADFILVSHGHFDHFGDTIEIARRTGATVIGIVELAWWLEKQGIKSVFEMNIGGEAEFEFGRVKMTPALHSSTMPDGSPGGLAASFLLKLADGNIYFGCDTALFSDMSLIGREGIKLAILPIGDIYTMGPADALEAVKLLSPNKVIPCHYSTWEKINQDPDVWAELVRAETDSEPTVMQPGQKITLT